MNIKEGIREGLGSKILDWKEHSARRIYFLIDQKDIVEVTKLLFKELGLRFSIATGTDTPEGFEMLYHFSHDNTGQFYSVRVLIKNKEKPEIDSIAPLFPGAEWIEREIWELVGINFKGHPNLKRLLLADDWPEGDYPLRQK
ncbi:MAG: NADH-quinone oxidoreductase subunit C [Candidatus Omnitrophica bacterium]|nr:NADH-quinone oxidoreductase subunit C [Candidatus Omnitrophota bacterium]MBU1869326.1 NADH-quinone oxidoreductase subunit C [Candidatus Omnitrophota bacterium]